EGMATRFMGLAEENRGMLNSVIENPAMQLASRGASGVLGGLSIAQGVGEWQGGNKTQGGFDMVAGGLGVAAMLQPELAPIALAGDLVGGVANAGIGLGKLAVSGGEAIGSGASWLGGKIGDGASAIGSGLASGASALGSGIKSVGSGIGNAVSSVFSW